MQSVDLKQFFVFAGLLATETGCQPERAPLPADLVVQGGQIHLEVGVVTERIAARKGVVVATGADVEALLDANTEVIDLDGAVAFPGMQDAHVHLLAGSFVMDRLILLGRSSMSSIASAVEGYASETPDEPWIVGYGWMRELVEDPNGLVLDQVVSDRPVILVDNSGHSALVNSVALARAGITRDTEDPPGGEIVRDEDGEPTGYLLEEALALVSDVALADYDDSALSSGLEDALEDFTRGGLTGVCEIVASPGFDLSRPWIYSELEAAGALDLRVHYFVPIFSPDGVEAAAAFREIHDGELVRMAGAKVWVDGSVGTSDAWTMEPLEGTTDDVGSYYFDEADLIEIIRDAEHFGVPLKLHANGDAAVHAALAAFEAVASEGTLELQHTLEHAVLIHDDDFARIAELGLVVSIQPTHPIATALGDVAEDWGDERYARAYDYRRLADAGVVLALGTDWPVWPTPDAIIQVWGAAAMNGDHGLTTTEALRGYTTGTATSLGLANELGCLNVGCLADLVVYDGDPLRVDPSRLSELFVSAVYVGGREVYRSER